MVVEKHSSLVYFSPPLFPASKMHVKLLHHFNLKLT